MHQEAYHTTWDKDLDANLPHPPPPAYGRWRGSVRANPELLHWSPVVPPGTPAMPSPTYETAMRDAVRGAMAMEEQQGQDEVVIVEIRTSPPSYSSSPARRIPEEVARQTQAEAIGAGGGDRPSSFGEPEMIEGRGIGIAD
ncbi:hypothetical protein Tdes44962_MAKER03565 [Teratosphaeria destructans]|uniref:Uncharacterized protein n=1 Tax=Teratosphaeria destructans TaxID=418781 RepID=A0A9W7SPT5_9PEZI|nr:hypothetical protein Tdes44962_MAKER03565 [Teratosphaeria destructans]